MSQSRILNYYSLNKIYNKYLNQLRPKVILVICYYTFSIMVLTELAKKRGIKVIELQHGIMGAQHLAYNFYRKLDLPQFPDYVFLFGDIWRAETRFPLDENNLLITGFPYFERHYNHLFQNNNTLIKTFLFISQGTIGKELSKMAVELNKRLDLNKFRFIYKLHPGEFSNWKEEYPWLYNSNIEVIDHNRKSLYYYFQQADYQVGVYSTGIIEGLGFNLQTFIYKLYGHDRMKFLYNSGYAQLVNSASDVVSNLTKKDIDYEAIRNLFWAFDSIKKMKKAITQIIEE